MTLALPSSCILPSVSASVSLDCEEYFLSVFDTAPHILSGVLMPVLDRFLFMLRSLYLRLGRLYFHEREDQEDGVVLDWMAWSVPWCSRVGTWGDLCLSGG